MTEKPLVEVMREARAEAKRLEHYSLPHLTPVYPDCIECWRVEQFKKLQGKVVDK